MTVRDHTRSLC